jgi:opacity protein-like surface antigen
MVFAAGGVGAFSNTPSVFCGTVTDCSGSGTKLNYQGGGTIWLTRFAAFDASYIGHVTATNAGELSTSSFDSSLSTKVAVVSVKLGLPLKVVRPYALIGGNYHWATFKTTQVIKNRTVTVDDVETTITGGTQAFQWKTEGKGWVWGAGMEVPVGKTVQLYAEGGYIQLRGRDTGNGEYQMKDSLTYAVAGIKIRLGK